MQCGVTTSIAECSHVTLVLFLIGNRWTRAYFALSLSLSLRGQGYSRRYWENSRDFCRSIRNLSCSSVHLHGSENGERWPLKKKKKNANSESQIQSRDQDQGRCFVVNFPKALHYNLSQIVIFFFFFVEWSRIAGASACETLKIWRKTKYVDSLWQNALS